MVILKENKSLLSKYNERIRELCTEYPEWAEDFRELKTLDDMFCPYQKWVDELTEEDIKKYNIISDKHLCFDGIYITNDCNNHYNIKNLTDYEEINHLYDYGVADNATQILQNVKIPENAIVLIMPIFKDLQPKNDGWRWHKWGYYYGVQNPQCEYIANEKEIELVYAFSVITLKEKEDNNNERQN